MKELTAQKEVAEAKLSATEDAMKKVVPLAEQAVMNAIELIECLRAAHEWSVHSSSVYMKELLGFLGLLGSRVERGEYKEISEMEVPQLYIASSSFQQGRSSDSGQGYHPDGALSSAVVHQRVRGLHPDNLLSPAPHGGDDAHRLGGIPPHVNTGVLRFFLTTGLLRAHHPECFQMRVV
jgi:hypothetical protein